MREFASGSDVYIERFFMVGIVYICIDLGKGMRQLDGRSSRMEGGNSIDVR